MRVLFVATDFYPEPGGVAVFLHHLATQLARQGHHVDVLTPPRTIEPGVDVRQPYTVHEYVVPRRLSSVIRVYRVLDLHLRTHYDVVLVGHFMTTHALGVLVLHKLCNVPYAILSHGNDLQYSINSRVDAIVARWLLGNVALLLSNSRFTAERIRQAGHRRRVEVLNPGVDTTQFRPDANAEHIRREWELGDRRVVLTTARLVAIKNVDAVLRALPQVIARVPDVLYIIAGDGEERERLGKMVDELDLHPYVRFLGYVEHNQLPSLYCASNLYVMPSYIETFGISFVEASACGLPVIGGHAGGTADAVIDGETGLLVDPHSVDDITEAMIRLLTDSELAHRLGRNGRKRVEQHLSWQNVSKRLEDYLSSLIITKEGENGWKEF